ncbi:pentapeptide repeat-containing protein [Streptomyces purpurascens]|uniref:pentapeptide repeat-containing protein n=1 Tax=Streptomyces purpurascens TaxID=1924 RepID=UPI003C2F10A3
MTATTPDGSGSDDSGQQPHRTDAVTAGPVPRQAAPADADGSADGSAAADPSADFEPSLPGAASARRGLLNRRRVAQRAARAAQRAAESEDDRLDRRERRATRAQWAMAFATLVPGLAAVGALLFTADSLRQSQDSIAVTQQGQITDRYNNAVSNLGDDSEDVRLGGMYALERILEDSPRDREPICNVLSAYVRGHAVRPKEPVKSADDRFDIRPGRDVITALQILSRNQAASDASVVDLTGTYLRGMEFDGIQLAFADLRDVDLSWAILRDANLRKANLDDAKLSADLAGADLNLARLHRADLGAATLRGSKMFSAQLARANLRVAQLQLADLNRANLRGADLRGANLVGADLTKATLRWADLRGADLGRVRGLTAEQVLETRLATNTVLPDDIGGDPRVKEHMTSGDLVHPSLL